MPDQLRRHTCHVVITLDVDTDTEVDAHYLTVWAHARSAELVVQLRQRGLGADPGHVSVDNTPFSRNPPKIRP